MRVTAICLAAAVLGIGSAVPVMGARLDAPTGLTGNVTTDVWDFSTIAKNSDWKTNPWTPIASNPTTGAANAEFTKTSGTAYPLDGLIYTSGTESIFTLTADPAANNIENVVIQIFAGDGFGSIGTAPALSVTGGSQDLATGNSGSAYLGKVPTPIGPQDGNIWLYQWDLSAETAVSSIAIDWSMLPHSQIYEIRLDQSDVFSQASISPTSVPEPGALALVSLGGLALLARRRRQRA